MDLLADLLWLETIKKINLCHETLPVPGFKDKLTFFSSSTYFLIAASYLLKCSGWWNSASLFYYNTFWFTTKEKVIAHVISLLYLTSWKAYPKMKQKVKYQIIFPLSTARSEIPCDKTVLSGHWHSMVIHLGFHLLPRRRNVKYTVPEENLERDVSSVPISGKSCHIFVGPAYPTWRRTLQKWKNSCYSEWNLYSYALF